MRNAVESRNPLLFTLLLASLLWSPQLGEAQQFAASVWDLPPAHSHALWDGVHLGVTAAAANVGVHVSLGSSAWRSSSATAFGWTSGRHAYQSAQCWDIWYDPWAYYHPYCDWGWYAFGYHPGWWPPAVHHRPRASYRSRFAFSLTIGGGWHSPYYDPWFYGWHPVRAYPVYRTVYVAPPVRWIHRPPPTRTVYDPWRPTQVRTAGTWKEDPRTAAPAPGTGRVAVPRGTATSTGSDAPRSASPATGTRPATSRDGGDIRSAAPPPDLRTRIGNPSRENPRATATDAPNHGSSPSSASTTPQRQSSPPAASATPPRQSSPPAASRTPPRQSSPPAASRTPPRQSSPPAASATPPRQSSPPAASRTPPRQSSPPAASRTPPRQSSPPAASRTPPRQSSPPAASRTPPHQSSPPAASRTPPRGGPPGGR